MPTEQEILDSWEVKRILILLKKKYPFITGIYLHENWEEHAKYFYNFGVVIDFDKLEDYLGKEPLKLTRRLYENDDETYINNLKLFVSSSWGEAKEKADEIDKTIAKTATLMNPGNVIVPDELKLRGNARFFINGYTLKFNNGNKSKKTETNEIKKKWSQTRKTYR